MTILNNVFTGDNAIIDYLNPENNIPTPLVELPEKFNKYKKDGVQIFAKLMNTLPLGNIKSLPALNMLLLEKGKGGLNNVHTIIENSSGNTVFSLSVIAKHLGINKTKAVVSHEVSLGKLNLLRFLDTEIIVNKEPICPDPSDKESGIYKAKNWAKENNWFNPGQYDNEANPEAHYKWTAPQIWEQMNGDIDVLVTTLGTTGTIYGLGKFFKEKNKNIKVIGVARAINNPIPGPRTQSLLRQIAFDWKSVTDVVLEGETNSSYKLSMELSRSGILVGPSSGLALLGVYKYLNTLKRKERKNLNIVFICPDSPFPYINDYFEVLNNEDFPEIENQELLLHKENTVNLEKNIEIKVREVEAKHVASLCFDCLGYATQEKKKVKILIIDVRSREDFNDHHIENAKNIPFQNLEKYVLESGLELRKFKKIICVCQFGVKSKVAAEILVKNGFFAESMGGGMAKWSKENYPRIKPKGCIIKKQ